MGAETNSVRLKIQEINSYAPVTFSNRSKFKFQCCLTTTTEFGGVGPVTGCKLPDSAFLFWSHSQVRTALWSGLPTEWGPGTTGTVACEQKDQNVY